MGIDVKYFGKSGPFEGSFENMTELQKVFGKTNRLGQDGKGVVFQKDSHGSFRDLDWEASGHVGEPNKVAGWDATGLPVAVEVDAPEVTASLDTTVFGISIDEDQSSALIYSRRIVLHSPGAGWSGNIWTLADSTVSLVGLTGDVVIYMHLEDDISENEPYVSTTFSSDHICCKLYTVTIDGNDISLTRVWNPGDVDVLSMWLISE